MSAWREPSALTSWGRSNGRRCSLTLTLRDRRPFESLKSKSGLDTVRALTVVTPSSSEISRASV